MDERLERWIFGTDGRLERLEKLGGATKLATKKTFSHHVGNWA